MQARVLKFCIYVRKVRILLQNRAAETRFSTALLFYLQLVKYFRD